MTTVEYLVLRFVFDVGDAFGFPGVVAMFLAPWAIIAAMVVWSRRAKR